MTKKRILLLGGSYFQIPAIKYAKNKGYYVITADYLPNNPGHKYSDEYHNVSTIDKEAILKLAREMNVDGVLSYASDPGAPTAAYVTEKLNLPGNPYKSVLILQRKDLFRSFLKNNGFNVPESGSFNNYYRALIYADELLKYYKNIIVKPADSSGSKGVTKINNIKNFEQAYDTALNFSICKKVIIEQFIEKVSYQMDGDGFVWNEKLVFRCFGNQHNDHLCHSYVPAGISFPFVQNKDLQQKAHNDIERILSLLKMKVGGLNIEYITDENDEVYIVEIGPRSGGNLIPEVIKYSTGVDLIAYSVDGALGKDCGNLKMKETSGFYSSYILHAQSDGVFNSMEMSSEIENRIVEQNIFIKKGDSVRKFNGSHDTLGTFILKFDNQVEMLDYLDNMNEHIRVIVD